MRSGSSGETERLDRAGKPLCGGRRIELAGPFHHPLAIARVIHPEQKQSLITRDGTRETSPGLELLESLDHSAETDFRSELPPFQIVTANFLRIEDAVDDLAGRERASAVVQ